MGTAELMDTWMFWPGSPSWAERCYTYITSLFEHVHFQLRDRRDDGLSSWGILVYQCPTNVAWSACLRNAPNPGKEMKSSCLNNNLLHNTCYSSMLVHALCTARVTVQTTFNVCTYIHEHQPWEKGNRMDDDLQWSSSRIRQLHVRTILYASQTCYVCKQPLMPVAVVYYTAVSLTNSYVVVGWSDTAIVCLYRTLFWLCPDKLHTFLDIIGHTKLLYSWNESTLADTHPIASLSLARNLLSTIKIYLWIL